MRALEYIDLDRIAIDVFQTMLTDDVVAVNEPWIRDSHRLAAAVRFAGPEPGALLIECSKTDACQVAKLLTGVSHDSVTEDVIDGLAEVANMVGGNLKSALHAGVGLSMPSVVDSSGWTTELFAGRPIHRGVFACGSVLLWVTYLSER